MGWKDLEGDVAALFGELQPDVESALYRAHQHRRGEVRETRKLDHAGRRATYRAAKQRERDTTEMLKAWRAARVPAVIPPIGRPPELEAAAQRIGKRVRLELRRKKIAALANARCRARAETSPALQDRRATHRG